MAGSLSENLESLRRENAELKEREKDFLAESERLVEVNLNNAMLISEIQQKNRIIEQAKRDIHLLLDNLAQGYLLFDAGGTIQPGASRAATDLFGMEPEGKSLGELLSMEATDAEFTRQWVGMLFQTPIPFADLKDLGPKIFTAKGRHVELDFRPIPGKDGKPEKVILVATDRTEEHRLKQQAEAEESLARMVLAILKDRNGFADFMKEAEAGVRELEVLMSTSAPDVHHCFRLAHTLKGNSACYSLTDLAGLAHELESNFGLIRDSDIEDSLLEEAWQEARSSLKKLTDGFEAFLKEHGDIVGTLRDEERTRSLPEQELRKMATLLSKKIGWESQLVREFHELFVLDSLEPSLRRYKKTVEDMGERYGKPLSCRFHCQVPKLHLEPYRPLLQALIHPLRNAVDHGMETPEERVAASKSEQGRVSLMADVVTEQNVHRLRLRIMDDGRGMDPDKIRAKALKKGLLTGPEAEKASNEDLFALIFTPGFSTADAVTEISGRGVGLDSLAAEVGELGGVSRVESSPGKGTTFTLLLPLFDYEWASKTKARRGKEE